MERHTRDADATAQAELVRRGAVSPKELVRDAIERIERINPCINAVIHERFEKALEEASRDLPRGPFRGVPVLLKDVGTGAMADEPMHAGTRFLQAINFKAQRDAYVVQRLQEAGFVVVGRTTTPELGTSMTTEALSTGLTRNPWNLDYSTGGSSGGAAAAVAARFTAVAHGNDGAGSLRMPASACGVVALKPTRGRVSLGPDVGETRMGALTLGCLSRTVRDSAAFLDSVTGYFPGDPNTAPPSPRPYADEVGRDPGSLRIGLLDRPLHPEAPHHPETEAAVQRTGKVLERLGHRVEVAHPQAMEEAVEFTDVFRRVLGMGVEHELSAWERRLGRLLLDADVEPWNLNLREIGRQHSAGDLLSLTSWIHAYTRRMASWWAEESFDILVTPVTSSPIGKLGRLTDPVAELELTLREVQFTPQFNLTGQPAIVLPMHHAPDGVPVGVQFVAAFAREHILVRLAAQLEVAEPWHSRTPLPLCESRNEYAPQNVEPLLQ